MALCMSECDFDRDLYKSSAACKYNGFGKKSLKHLDSWKPKKESWKPNKHQNNSRNYNPQKFTEGRAHPTKFRGYFKAGALSRFGRMSSWSPDSIAFDMTEACKDELQSWQMDAVMRPEPVARDLPLASYQRSASGRRVTVASCYFGIEPERSECDDVAMNDADDITTEEYHMYKDAAGRKYGGYAGGRNLIHRDSWKPKMEASIRKKPGYKREHLKNERPGYKPKNYTGNPSRRGYLRGIVKSRALNRYAKMLNWHPSFIAGDAKEEELAREIARTTLLALERQNTRLAMKGGLLQRSPSQEDDVSTAHSDSFQIIPVDDDVATLPPTQSVTTIESYCVVEPAQ